MTSGLPPGSCPLSGSLRLADRGGPTGRIEREPIGVRVPSDGVNGDRAGVSRSPGTKNDQELDGSHPGQVDSKEVDVGGIEARELVAQRVEPGSGLARVAARLVHHAPLRADQVVGGGDVGEVLAVLEEQQGLGGVGPVKPRQTSGPSRGPAPLRARADAVASMAGTGDIRRWSRAACRVRTADTREQRPGWWPPSRPRWPP